MALQSNTTVDTFAALRLTMVDSQIRTFDVTDRAVIERFLAVEREKFVPPQLSDLAYSDMALKIAPAKSGASERRLLAPMVLARLLQAAAVKMGEHVLDVAPGTGYSTAILAGLTPNVVALNPILICRLRRRWLWRHRDCRSSAVRSTRVWHRRPHSM